MNYWKKKAASQNCLERESCNLNIIICILNCKRWFHTATYISTTYASKGYTTKNETTKTITRVGPLEKLCSIKQEVRLLLGFGLILTVYLRPIQMICFE
mmetsp:Transcript_6874/g.9231  ORF Transcript_6874/g.9231 Transcript_6874/m.9231 type:complete len:99 (+) Transcript_6874:687-983(+)